MSDTWFDLASTLQEVVILAYFGLDDPVWQPYLEFPQDKIKFLIPYGATKAGFYLHAMVCALGVWGYLEKGIKDVHWEVVKNEDEVSIGDVYRFNAELNPSAMIPGTELRPKALTSSVHSSVSSTSTPSLSPVDQSISYTQPKRWYMHAVEAADGSFREVVSKRDEECVLTGIEEDLCQPAHLINRYNSGTVINSIVHHRNRLGGEDMQFWRLVQGTHDVRLGLFLSTSLHEAMDKFHLGPYRVPNFGMKSLTEPADNIHLNRIDCSPAPLESAPMQPLTAEALSQLNSEIHAPADWAGTNGTVFLVPFDKSARMYTQVRVGDDSPRMQSQPEGIRMPTARKRDQWPPNLCFDWAWGGRVLKVFGSHEALEYAKLSPLGAMVQDFRKKRKAKVPVDETTPTKRQRNASNPIREICRPKGGPKVVGHTVVDGGVEEDLVLGINVQEVTLAKGKVIQTYERVERSL